MTHSLAVMDSVRRSNLPNHEKSSIQRFYDNLTKRASGLSTSVGEKLGMARHSISAGSQAVRRGGEALLVGGALGALDAQLGKGDPTKSGLDVNINVGSGYNLPIDAAVGVAGFLASMAPSLAKAEDDLQTVGVIGVASWSQRMTKGWVAARQGAAPAGGGSAPAGVHGDPVLDWAASQT